MAGSAPALTLNTLCRLWEVGRSGLKAKTRLLLENECLLDGADITPCQRQHIDL